MLCVDDTLERVEMRGEYIMDESGCGDLLIEFAEVFHCLLNTQIRSLHEWEWKRGHTISEPCEYKYIHVRTLIIGPIFINVLYISIYN